MAKIVQKIDFVLGYTQIIKMILDADTTGIVITLGVTEDAQIIIEASGVKIDKAGVVTATSGPEQPCPIPPGCPKDDACRQKVLSVMPAEVNTESLELKAIFEKFFK